MEFLTNSSFSCGSAIVSSHIEGSQTNTGVYEKRWTEEREIEIGKWSSPMYYPLEVGTDSGRDTLEYNWEDGNQLLCQREVYWSDTENTCLDGSLQLYIPKSELKLTF
jgi:hypothetical protein